jgi:hypothetical protein
LGCMILSPIENPIFSSWHYTLVFSSFGRPIFDASCFGAMARSDTHWFMLRSSVRHGRLWADPADLGNQSPPLVGISRLGQLAAQMAQLALVPLPTL